MDLRVVCDLWSKFVMLIDPRYLTFVIFSVIRRFLFTSHFHLRVVLFNLLAIVQTTSFPLAQFQQQEWCGLNLHACTRALPFSLSRDIKIKKLLLYPILYLIFSPSSSLVFWYSTYVCIRMFWGGMFFRLLWVTTVSITWRIVFFSCSEFVWWPYHFISLELMLIN